jgi:hypothetical protein
MAGACNRYIVAEWPESADRGRDYFQVAQHPLIEVVPTRLLEGQMKRVFLSFKMEDKKQVDGVRLLAWHEHVDLEFYDESVRVPYNSENAAYIRSKIKEKIERSSVVVALLGVNTYKSEWVDWELRTAKALGKKVVLMGLPNGPARLQLPPSVEGQTWWLWSVAELKRQIDG